MSPERFRGQYAVSRSSALIPETFRTSELAEGWRLHSHRGSPVAIMRGGRGAAALIGHAMDWKQPERSQDDVLQYLLETWDPSAVAARSARLAGRWALVVIGDECFALNDACGTMGIVWGGDGLAASAQLLDLITGPLTPVDRPAFDAHRTHKCHSGRPLPGRATEFAEARKLLPNHWLDMRSGEAVRFHPTRRYPALSALEVAPQVAQVLAGIVAAAANRGPLALGLTSGYDSRALAAALSTIPGLPRETVLFTMEDDFACPPGHFDITGGRRIAETIGGEHRVFRATPAEADAVAECRASEYMIAPRFERWADAWSSSPLGGRIVLSGWCSETGRARLRWEGSEDATAAQVLGCLDATGFSEFLDDIGRWHAEARRFRDELNIPIIDLLYWELKGSGWIAAGLNILNTGTDCISVYSCRDLLDLMLSVAEDQRGGKEELLCRDPGEQESWRLQCHSQAAETGGLG